MKKRKTKFSLLYAILPLFLIGILMGTYYLFLVLPQNEKRDFLQIALRTWHVQNTLKEFFVEDDYLYNMAQSKNFDEMAIKFKDINRLRSEKGKLYSSELSILRGHCEENRFCRKSEFGILAINNLEGFADAIRNNDLNLAKIYDNNSTDFMRLVKYDLLKFKGKLDNLDLSRIVALGNADLLVYKKYREIDNYCGQISEELKNDPLYLKYCSSQRDYGKIEEKTCYTEKILSMQDDCKRSKEYLKQILQ